MPVDHFKIFEGETVSVFAKSSVYQPKTSIFGKDGLGVIRFDKSKYPSIEHLVKQQISYFWVPEEIDLSKDANDFKTMPEHEQHIFTSNIRRQIVLDSIQGRAPTMTLLPLVQLPEVEGFVTTWAFFETIHSRSYTHILRNIYPNPSSVFDAIADEREIIECADDAVSAYDRIDADSRTWKRDVWRCLATILALEGIRFYVSFACAFSFAERKILEGNAKVLKLIARDENLHVAFVTQLMKLLPKDDPAFAAIEESERDRVEGIFGSVRKQEIEWCRYLFRNGSVVGLSEGVMTDYINWIASRRMKALKYDAPWESPRSNPLPWIEGWTSSRKSQPAPQEVSITAYTTGDIKQDMGDGFKLDLKL